MDAVLAVSALAMASAVAWADWVMSCCGVGSEAIFLLLDGQIMVRSEKTRGYGKKMVISWKPSVWLSSNLDRTVFRGYSTYRCGCRQCHHVSVSTTRPPALSYAFWECILGIRQSFSWLKTWKDTPFVLPVWFTWMSIHIHSSSLFCSQKTRVPWNMSPLPITATMVYNEVMLIDVTLKTFIEH